MKRRHLLIVLLLLPLLARSLLPSGFMWGSGAESGRVVFCPDTFVSLATQSDHAGHHQQRVHDHSGHQQHADHQGGDAQNHHDHESQAHAGSQCPFAVAAVTAPPAFIAGVIAFVSVSFQDVAPLPVHGAGLVSWRTHPIRGPPALS